MAAKQGFPYLCPKRSGKYQISQQKESDSSYKQVGIDKNPRILPLLAIMVLSLHKQCVCYIHFAVLGSSSTSGSRFRSYDVRNVTMVQIMPQSQNNALNSTWKLLFLNIQQRFDAICCQNTLPLHPPCLILNFLSFQHCCCCFLQRG